MDFKLFMLQENVIPCDDLECHVVLSSFELVLNSNLVAKERCLGSFSICMCAPLNPKVGLAKSLPILIISKTLHKILAPQRCGSLFKVNLNFKMAPHFCCS